LVPHANAGPGTDTLMGPLVGQGHAFGFAAGVFAGWLVMRHELGRLPSCLSVAVFGRPALQGELLPASTSQGYGTIGGK